MGRPGPGIGIRECLERLRAHPLWAARDRLGPDEGVGVAAGVWLGAKQPAAATCRLEPDGTITVVTGAVDMSGNATTFAAIAAETFGVPFESVTVVFADTQSGPPSPPSNASAITYAVGPAIASAVAEARDQLLRVAAAELEIRPEDLDIVDGIVIPRGSPGSGRPVAEFARDLSETFNSEHPPVEGHAAVAHAALAPSAIAALAHVALDRDTGAVTLKGYVAVQDVGYALNPAVVEGQLHGGSVQSIGRALVEALVHDDAGPAADRHADGLRAPEGVHAPGPRRLVGGGPGARRSVRGQGHGRGPDAPRPAGDRQRDRGGLGTAVAGTPDDSEASLGSVPVARQGKRVGSRRTRLIEVAPPSGRPSSMPGGSARTGEVVGDTGLEPVTSRM